MLLMIMMIIKENPRVLYWLLVQLTDGSAVNGWRQYSVRKVEFRFFPFFFFFRYASVTEGPKSC